MEMARNNGNKADYHFTEGNAHIQHLIPKHLTPVVLQCFLKPLLRVVLGRLDISSFLSKDNQRGMWLKSQIQLSEMNTEHLSAEISGSRNLQLSSPVGAAFILHMYISSSELLIFQDSCCYLPGVSNSFLWKSQQGRAESQIKIYLPLLVIMNSLMNLSALLRIQRFSKGVSENSLCCY